MVTTLVPCSSCARHVRASETACPFCAVALTGIAKRAPLSPVLTRAAFMFASATALAACGKEQGPVPPPPGPSDKNDMRQAPAYGAPPPDTAMVAPAVLYGAPPENLLVPPDAGTTDAGKSDAGKPKK